VTTTLNPKTRNYRFGWTNSVSRDHRHFADFAPCTGYLGAAGIIREYSHVARNNNSNAWTCAIWQGDTVIARGKEADYLIGEYQLHREMHRNIRVA